MSLDRLKKEEAEMEELYYSKASSKEPEVGTEDLLAGETTKEETAELEAVANSFEGATPQEVVEDSVQPEKPARTNWKKRYTNFKASTDTTIFQLRQENATLKESLVGLRGNIADLTEQLTALKPSTFDGVITQEDEDTIGPDAVKIMKKTSEALSKPLEEKLKQLEDEKRAREVADAKASRADASAGFKGKLVSLVEDFDKVDLNPKFLQYLGETDPQTGVPRKEFFDRAVAYGDFVRTAGFYNDFARSLPQSKESILAKKVAPIGGGATPSAEGVGRPKTYTMEEFDKTYSDYQKGAYRNLEEKNNLIKKMDLLDKAFTEGRIT